MAFLNKLNDLAKNIGDKTSEAIETTKLSAKISSEKSAVSDLLKQIGEYYYGAYQQGLEPDAEVKELFAAIDGHNGAIADLQAEIDKIKGESARPAAAAGPSAVCPACGAANAGGAKFCASCGGKLEAEGQKRFCPECGAAMPEGTRFCPECGNKAE